MKNKMIKLAVAAVAAVALAQTSQATLITGNIGFSGSAVLNSGTEAGATQVVSWGSTLVTSDSGTFATIPTIVVNTTPVTFNLAPWNFNSSYATPGTSFWTVGNFTFDLLSSSIYSNSGGFLNVVLSGIVTDTIDGFTATGFNGSFQLGDPSSNGQTTFTTRLSFNSVPDGGITVMLLGAALSGLALIKRKLVA
jgi:hypothetical protein